jgi:methylthioribulose-1-phosphate dehydratase
MSLSPCNESDVSPTILLQQLIEAIHFLHAHGWTPATSSNFSCRTSESAPGFWISISGLDKEALNPNDFIVVDYAGQIINKEQAHIRPSAETLLHALIYRLYPQAKVVMHCHSVNGTVLSKLYETEQGLWLKNFELLKGFEGIKTHDTQIWLPIFPNAQDMECLAQQVEKECLNWKLLYGFMLAGHGLYTWGETVAQAKRHVEVFEFLFEAILKLRSYGYSDYSR